ncbi:hypothetical protein [Geothrix sp. 21YS21S-2]|uniref:hypothetical protein n=1 Tax=Geothrix sp. 21YS21S-2 TaxID=3068893 RepID=UPI0027B916BB|nr:hypothetical protein [Geothrix sp. 21YS21S-2]
MVRPSASKPPPPGAVPASLRFHCSGELNRRTCAALDRIERSTDPVQHREALAEVVVALTACGLDAYFMEPLKKAKAGFVTQQSASLGMAGARKLMGSVIRSIIVRMDGPQLVSVCGSIREFMR